MDFYEDEFSSTWRTSTKSWLLSWNPKNWQWTTLADDRAKTSVGEVVTRAQRLKNGPSGTPETVSTPNYC